jgi:HemK-like putative methylase
MYKRNWSVYEKNCLLKHGFSLSNLQRFGDKPVEYITGSAQFMGYDFAVSPDVLIPRLESEGIVSLAISFLGFRKNSKETDFVIADVGTGSGCIGISTFLKATVDLGLNSKILMSDISQKAIKIAEKNLRSLVIVKDCQNFSLFRSDLLAEYSCRKLDLILANLPYVPSALLEKTDKSVVDHEPTIALDGGEDGLFLIRKLINQSRNFLSTRGLIVLEVDQRAIITAKSLGLEKSGLNFLVIKDQFKRQRYVLLGNYLDDEFKEFASVINSNYNQGYDQ